jgi:hypothetical protein
MDDHFSIETDYFCPFDCFFPLQSFLQRKNSTHSPGAEAREGPKEQHRLPADLPGIQMRHLWWGTGDKHDWKSSPNNASIPGKNNCQLRKNSGKENVSFKHPETSKQSQRNMGIKTQS